MNNSSSLYTYQGENKATLFVSGEAEGPANLTRNTTAGALAFIKGLVSKVPGVGVLLGSISTSGPNPAPLHPKGRYDGERKLCCEDGKLKELGSSFTSAGTNPPFSQIFVE
jgi:hypothetical protein